MTLRLLIVDDQEMIRVGLRAILERHDQFTISGEAFDGLQAVSMVENDPVDVVIMDIRMPGIDGVEATRRIRRTWPAEKVRIIVLTTFEHDQTVLAALRAGANGHLSKATGPTELIQAIEEVASGGGALSAAAAAALIGHMAEQPVPLIDDELVERFRTLTPRERDIVTAVASGLDNEGIAEALFISAFTVKTHANRAMNKVGARDRAQLVAFAYKAGLAG